MRHLTPAELLELHRRIIEQSGYRWNSLHLLAFLKLLENKSISLPLLW